MKSSGRKPTREERKIIAKANLDTYEWLVQKHTTTELQIISRKSSEIKIISL